MFSWWRPTSASAAAAAASASARAARCARCASADFGALGGARALPVVGAHAPPGRQRGCRHHRVLGEKRVVLVVRSLGGLRVRLGLAPRRGAPRAAPRRARRFPLPLLRRARGARRLARPPPPSGTAPARAGDPRAPPSRAEPPPAARASPRSARRTTRSPARGLRHAPRAGVEVLAVQIPARRRACARVIVSEPRRPRVARARWGRSGRTRAYSPSPGAPRGNARRSARAPPPRRGVPAPTSPAGGRACSRARRARARARAPTRAAPPSPRSARPGRRRQPVGFHECSAGARRGSEARGGRSCRSRGRGCRKWFPRRSIQRRGEKEQPGRGRTPVVRLLALCTSASRSLASKRFVRGKLSLPIRGRTMVGGRARRGVNDDWWRLELTCSETCRQKPGFIRPSIFDKSGRGPSYV